MTWIDNLFGIIFLAILIAGTAALLSTALAIITTCVRWTLRVRVYDVHAKGCGNCRYALRDVNAEPCQHCDRFSERELGQKGVGKQ